MATNDKNNQPKRLYNTAIINQLIEDSNMGLEIDTAPFYMGDIELREANIVFEYTPEEIEEFQKCMLDPVYFVRNYCKFQNDKGRTLVDLRDFQEEIIHAVCDSHYDEELDEMVPDHRNNIIMASRQVGKTTTLAACLAWFLCFNDSKNAMVLANKQATAIEIVDKIIQIFKGLPFFLKPGALNFGKMGLTLDNGCKLLSSATTASTSIGFTIHWLLVDEFAHIPKNIIEPFWRSVFPTLSSSKLSRCTVISTPNGQNMFFDIYSKSTMGTKENSFNGLRIDYWRVPGHDDAWADAMRRDFGADLFAQEFELQFSVNSKMLLNGSDLQFMNRIKQTYKYKDLYSGKMLENQKLIWHPDFDPLTIKPDDKFLLCIDLAEGKEYEDDVKDSDKPNDFGVINIFKIVPTSIANIRSKNRDKKIEYKDCFRAIQVGLYCDNENDEEYLANITSALLYNVFNVQNYDNARVMVEMNFQGKNFVTIMKNDINFYDDIIIKTYHSEPIPGEKRKKKYGFKTTGTKEYFCKRSAKMIGNKRIIVTEKDSILQLGAFGKLKGNTYGGISCHDDISITILNMISRAFEEELVVGWMQDLLEKHEDLQYKYKLNELIQAWELENPEIDDSKFNIMFSNNNDYYNNPMSTYSQFFKRY